MTSTNPESLPHLGSHTIKGYRQGNMSEDQRRVQFKFQTLPVLCEGTGPNMLTKRSSFHLVSFCESMEEGATSEGKPTVGRDRCNRQTTGEKNLKDKRKDNLRTQDRTL